MATAIEYALIAGVSYISMHSDINKFPVSKSWKRNVEYPKKSKGSSFETACFTDGARSLFPIQAQTQLIA